MLSALVVFSLAVLSDRPLISQPIAAAERLLADELPRNLDGRLGFAYLVARREGHPPGGKHWLLGNSVSSGSIAVNIRAGREVESELASIFARLGCEPFRLESGEVASVGPVVTARCTWEGLWALSALPGVEQIVPTFDYRIHRPLRPPTDLSSREVESAQLSEAFHPQGAGKGVTICDMDSGVDPFHPFFFHADGGAYDWLDLDGNGTFDPMSDAVDFNRNGDGDPDEALGVIKSKVTWFDWYTYARNLFNEEPAFLAGHDWLFQDENGDGMRNSGSAAPYGDAKPTFGEQLYVADDVNGNGSLDRGERLLRLHTPKLKAVRASPTSRGVSQVYRRGVNLSQVPEPFPGARDHGSMVLGTIGGGVANVTRYTGMAPESELLLAASDSMNLIADLAWARSEGAQIVLWEMSTWYGEFLDGSAPLEVAADSASNQGVLQMSAAGNLGGSQKHRLMAHPTGTQEVPLVIPANKAHYVYGNFLWRSQGGAVAFTLKLNDTRVPLTGTQGQVNAGGTTVQWGRYDSPRGTTMLLFYLTSPGGTVIPGQTAGFEVVNSGPQVALHGYVADDFTSWGKGVYWPESAGATDQGTYGTPGVGDRTIAIGTYYSNLLPTGAAKGGLAHYSGMGPRLDGADTVDFAAPEDHVTAHVGENVSFGAMWVGGGTSNASPVAVGAAAVLKALNPGATPAQLVAMLRQTAQSDTSTGLVPNDRWGYGKLRAYRAHFRTAPALDNQPPTAKGTAQWLDGGTLALRSGDSLDPEGTPLRFRWDLDYDGTWDLGPLTSLELTAKAPQPTPRFSKLEVADGQGRLGYTLVEVAGTGYVPSPPVRRSADGGTPYTVSQPGEGETLGPAEGLSEVRGFGCSAAGGSLGGSTLLLALAAGLRRRRHAWR